MDLAGDPAGQEGWTHTTTATMCVETGTKDGRIFWKRTKLVDGGVYVIAFDYPTERKAELDAIVGECGKPLADDSCCDRSSEPCTV